MLKDVDRFRGAIELSSPIVIYKSQLVLLVVGLSRSIVNDLATPTPDGKILTFDECLDPRICFDSVTKEQGDEWNLL